MYHWQKKLFHSTVALVAGASVFHQDRDRILSFLRALISCALIPKFSAPLEFRFNFFFFHSIGVLCPRRVAQCICTTQKKLILKENYCTLIFINCYFELDYLYLDKAFDLLCILLSHTRSHARGANAFRVSNVHTHHSIRSEVKNVLFHSCSALVHSLFLDAFLIYTVPRRYISRFIVCILGTVEKKEVRFIHILQLNMHTSKVLIIKIKSFSKFGLRTKAQTLMLWLLAESRHHHSKKQL